MVKAGETLSSIACQYKLQLNLLAKSRRSRTANVRIGQRLKVDASAAKNEVKTEVVSAAKAAVVKPPKLIPLKVVSL